MTWFTIGSPVLGWIYDFAVSVSLSYQATANSQAPLFRSGVSSAPNSGLEDQVYDVYKWFLLIF